MIPENIKQYANDCEKDRELPIPAFKVFVFEGKAYLLPLNLIVVEYGRKYLINYRDFDPTPLSADDLDFIADGVKSGQLHVKMETIDDN